MGATMTKGYLPQIYTTHMNWFRDPVRNVFEINNSSRRLFELDPEASNTPSGPLRRGVNGGVASFIFALRQMSGVF